MFCDLVLLAQTGWSLMSNNNNLLIHALWKWDINCIFNEIIFMVKIRICISKGFYLHFNAILF